MPPVPMLSIIQKLNIRVSQSRPLLAKGLATFNDAQVAIQHLLNNI
jgi:hypothetical protein